MTSKAHTMAAAVLLTLLLAGCGGSSSDSGTTTAAVTPAPTTTTPATLTETQMALLQRTSRSFVSSITTFTAALNRCVPAQDRAGCVQRAADRAERVVRRSRTRVSKLATGVGGDCQTQLSDVRGKMTEVTDILSPMAEATLRGRFRGASRLGANAQTALRGFAASSLIVDRAC
jgi:hypothetical protein